MEKIRIGTSGWSYPHWKKGVFYPDDLKEGEELEFYAKNFSSVEINSTFYHFPKDQTFINWKLRTPDPFVFSVKGSRFISHILKLDNASEPLANLLERAGLLDQKLGPILFQLPPTFEKDEPRLKKFLKLIPKAKKVTFEFRHKSWFTEAIYKALEEANAALTISDSPAYPMEKKATADFVYIRLHGHEQLYASSYTEEELNAWAKSISRWVTLNKDVYIYFDNDAHGFAPKNALRLKEILQGSK